jgi:iron complex outermembrane receptor protein
MNKSVSFKRTLIASAIASYALAGLSMSAFAQDESSIEEVVVLGVKGAQESAVNTKREAASVVDSISAEDIGKLPDATIADSLQRVPGIQIRRSAGEGGSINVRGLPQVSSQLNGESYLGANSITTFQPNFGDIPSQLFKGADVIKSPTGNLLNSGLSGTINLKTRRPFDFKDGVTGGAAVEAQYGVDSAEVDPSTNALVNWKNDTVGILLAGTYSKSNLANFYEGKQGNQGTGWMGMFGEGQKNANGITVIGNNDGDLTDQYAGFEGFSAYNKFTERERQGFNASFQADLGEGFELVADYFYTHQDEWNRATGVVAENKWAGFDYFSATKSRATGVKNINTVQKYDIELRRVQSYSEVNEFFSTSQDFNLELKYDNGGPLTASTRLVRGNASQHNLNNYFQGDLADGFGGNTNVVTDPVLGNRVPGKWVNPNPNGYTGLAHITIDHSGDDPVWGGWGNQFVSKNTGAPIAGKTLADYISNPAAYNTAAISSENNYDQIGKLSVLRGDASYKFDSGFITSVDAGYRLSEQSADKSVWQGVSNFYAGVAGAVDSSGKAKSDGCLARWKATDVTFNGDCSVGEMVGGKFVPFTAIGYVPQSQFKTIKVTDFGNIQGMPAFYAVDPKSLDDVEAFHKKFYGNYIHSQDPGASYNVKLSQQEYYVQGNFKADALSGNLGVRVIDTELAVKQNVVGASRSYGISAADAGDKLTNRDFRDVLPALNLAYDVTDDIKLRAAYSKNMTPLNLDSWGQAVQTSYALADGIQQITTVSYNGNPELDPWRSTNSEVSAEWYTAPGSLLSVGLFNLEIDSFPTGTNTTEPYPDLDGVIRRSPPTSKQIQGKGGSLHGVEFGAKQAFDFLPGIWSHFGIDANLTLTRGENKGVTDVNGKHPGFGDNSKTQYNLVVWYQDEALQARVAYNYRSDRVTGNTLGTGSGDLVEYQAPTSYLDANVSYDINDDWTVYMNASNITGEKERYYLQWKDQYLSENIYESRYTLGVRTRF